MRKDYRVKVKVVFTIDVGVEDTIFAGQDTAEMITRQVFEESFSRAHLLKVEAVELMTLGKSDESK